jgi:hypothetical protein
MRLDETMAASLSDSETEVAGSSPAAPTSVIPLSEHDNDHVGVLNRSDARKRQDAGPGNVLVDQVEVAAHQRRSTLESSVSGSTW